MTNFRHYVTAVFLLLAGLLAACQADDDQPDNLIDTDTMVQILSEVHIAESRASRLGISSTDSANMVYKRLQGRILRKYGVNTSTYEKSYVYYSSHPRKMEVIYKQIVAKLQGDSTSTNQKKAKKL